MDDVDDMDEAKISNQDYFIQPVYNTVGEIIMYEVYSEKSTKPIEKWTVVKE